MNLIFAASLLRETGAGGIAAEWKAELPALAARNVLFLWEDDPRAPALDAGALFPAAADADLLNWLRASDSALDETALAGNTPLHHVVARAASIACFYLVAPAEAVERRAAGEENIFSSVPELVNAVWKVNVVERKLFPVTTVGGLLLDEAGEALFVRTRKWLGRWGIPGGKLDYGETLEAAFRREIREETGLEIVSCRLVMVQDAVEPAEFYRPRHFVLVNYAARVAGFRPKVHLNHEGEDYFWASPRAALDRPLNGPTRALVEKILSEELDGKEGT